MHMNVCMLVYLNVWLLVYLSHASCHVHQLNSPYVDAAAHRVCVFYLTFVDLTDSGFICFICENSRIFADIHKYWFYSKIFIYLRKFTDICGYSQIFDFFANIQNIRFIYENSQIFVLFTNICEYSRIFVDIHKD